MTIDASAGPQSGMVPTRPASVDGAFVDGHELRQVLDWLPLPGLLHADDKEGEIVLVNEPFVHTFGYTRDDIPTTREWAVKAFPDEGYRQETSAAWGAAVAKARVATGRVEPLESERTPQP